ncbi:MAG: NAD(P)-dependent oxidoreductase [Bacilli bacterium]|jgi:nucleoside-diphosphate-sugar epimerase|nr:NAD(P)-dependent oxidoreductase [Bacilli bacterium]
MKKAIVTGADGFVGSHLVYELLTNGYIVYGIDLSNRPKRLKQHPNLIYISQDVSNINQLEKYFKKEDIYYFFHFAWRGSAGIERNDEEIQLSNTITTAKCLRFANQIGCRRFIVAGSIMEFETHSVVYSNDTKPNLSFIYGAGKVAAHQISKSIANAIGIDLLWVYITNAYGAGELSPRFINSTILKIINKENTNFSSGIQNYDFVYITDVAHAFRLVAEKGVANKGYMVGSGDAKPLKEFIIQLFETLAPNIKPSFGEIVYSGAMLPIEIYSIEEIINDCGFLPKINFSEGIRRTYDYLKEHKSE